MNRKQILIPLFTFFLLMGLFLPYYFLHQHEESKALSLIKRAERAPIVQIMRVKPDNKEIELILPSFLDAINTTPIWARTNGYLASWLVDIGDKVKEGDLLAIIDTPEVDQEVVQAEADLSAAIAKESITKITAQRSLSLFENNPEAISKEDVDQMLAAEAQAIADIESAKGRLAKFKYLQGFKNLYAPFDGVITERDIDIGSLITAGSNNNTQRCFQIAKSSVLRAFVSVPQNYFHLIKDGVEAELSVPEFPKKIFIGRINRNAAALDPISRTLLTQINIDNPREELLPGLYAEVKLKFKPEKNVYILPIEAVSIRSGPPCVAVVDYNNIVHFKKVTIGRDFGSSYEITDGISEGDEILSHITDRIKEGMKIQRSYNL